MAVYGSGGTGRTKKKKSKPYIRPPIKSQPGPISGTERKIIKKAQPLIRKTRAQVRKSIGTQRAAPKAQPGPMTNAERRSNAKFKKSRAYKDAVKVAKEAARINRAAKREEKRALKGLVLSNINKKAFGKLTIPKTPQLKKIDREITKEKKREDKDTHILGMNVEGIEDTIEMKKGTILSDVAKSLKKSKIGKTAYKAALGMAVPGLRQQGSGVDKLLENAYKDTVDATLGSPAALYLPTAAAKEAIIDKKPKRAKKLIRDLRKTDAIVGGVETAIKKGPVEGAKVFAKRAYKHPAITAAELRGGMAGLGRLGGAALRRAPKGSKAGRAGSTARKPIRLEPMGKVKMRREYSRDIFEKAGQKHLERRKAKRGGAPDLADTRIPLHKAFDSRVGTARMAVRAAQLKHEKATAKAKKATKKTTKKAAKKAAKPGGPAPRQSKSADTQTLDRLFDEFGYELGPKGIKVKDTTTTIRKQSQAVADKISKKTRGKQAEKLQEIPSKTVLPHKLSKLFKADTDPTDAVLFNRNVFPEIDKELSVANKKYSGRELEIKRAKIVQDGLARGFNETQNTKGDFVGVPGDIAERFEAHYKAPTKLGRIGRQATSQFTDVVLTTGAPVKWLEYNIGDLGTRSAFAGVGPSSVTRGTKFRRGLGDDYRAFEIKENLGGSGLVRSSQRGRTTRLEPKSKVAQILRKVPGAAYRYPRDAILATEQGIELVPQVGIAGRRIRNIVPRDWKSIAGAARMKPGQVKKAQKLVRDHPEIERWLASERDRLTGRWGQSSPAGRHFGGLAPFGQWPVAAARYAFWELPAHHPVKVGVFAALESATAKQRYKMGLSMHTPRDKRVPLYQLASVPIKVGNKVMLLNLGKATSLQAAGALLSDPTSLFEFIGPQAMDMIKKSYGFDFKGEKLVYPKDHKRAGQELEPVKKLEVVINAALEAGGPWVGMAKRVMEGGGKSDPTSTIFNPKTRPEWMGSGYKTPKGSTIKGLQKAFSPVPPKQKKYTNAQLDKFKGIKKKKGSSGGGSNPYGGGGSSGNPYN